MRRILIAGTGVFAVATAAFVIVYAHSRAEAQQPALTLGDPDIIFSENPELAAADKVAYDTTLDVAIEAEADAEAEPLPTVRDEYIDLLRRKAELMSDEQITEAMLQIKSDIGELEANRKLEELSTELRALVENYPESLAARKAQAMLAMGRTGVPQYGGPFPGAESIDAPYYNPSQPGPTPGDGSFAPIPSRRSK